MLLTRLCQDDRVPVPQPQRNLQIKFTRPLAGSKDFVAYVDAIGKLDGTRCLIEWKTSSSRYPEEPEGLLALDPRLEELKCFDEFLKRRFPGSRRKAYYLMSIHEHLPPQARKQLKELGWAKGLELAKLARRDRQHFDCAIWLHKARQMSTEQFKQEVERELTGKETEPWEIIYFKLYQNQVPVIERAIETAARMLGSDRSRGYCLEMVCADFLAGANLDHGDPEMLLFSMMRFFKFLPAEQQQAFLAGLSEKAS
jgi:hypothetical protein